MKNHIKITILLLIVHIGCASTPPAPEAATQEATIQETATQETTPEAPEPSRPDLQTELMEMREKDQAIRRQTNGRGGPPSQELIEELIAQDIAFTLRLQEIIQELGQWPDETIVGAIGSNAAWTIAQHANNTPGAQNFFLEYLKVAVDQGKASPRNYAYLIDRVLFHDDKPQIYGTQFKFTPDGVELAPVEDPENINKRRAEVGLGTIEEAVAQMKERMTPPPKDE